MGGSSSLARLEPPAFVLLHELRKPVFDRGPLFGIFGAFDVGTGRVDAASSEANAALIS